VECNNLIYKFFAREISDAELDQLKLWLESNPENRRIFNVENEKWQEASLHTKFENYKNDSAWKNISSRLGLNQNSSRSGSFVRNNYLGILIVAATVTLFLAIGDISLWIYSKRSMYKMVAGTTIIEPKEGEKAHIVLSDSSIIILNSDGRFQYTGNYNQDVRGVQVSGEAFFDVTTNHEKPFVVNLNKMSITATGTRFNVFSFASENWVETTLEECKIEFAIPGKDLVHVKSGQQVVYFVTSGDFIVCDVNTDTYTSGKENKLRFHDTSLEEVLRGIARKYNVTFEVSSHYLFDLKYTATFIDESIEEVMQMLKTVSR
jgi:transmembrane sensor